MGTLPLEDPGQHQPPPMEAHHADPVTGEDEFARSGELVMEPAGANGGARRGDGAAPRGQTLRNRPVGAAIDPKNPATWGKVARNTPCPCGSGKKYKHCHGQFA